MEKPGDLRNRRGGDDDEGGAKPLPLQFDDRIAELPLQRVEYRLRFHVSPSPYALAPKFFFFMMIFCSLMIPSISASGRGGQPGM